MSNLHNIFCYVSTEESPIIRLSESMQGVDKVREVIQNLTVDTWQGWPIVVRASTGGRVIIEDLIHIDNDWEDEDYAPFVGHTWRVTDDREGGVVAYAGSEQLAQLIRDAIVEAERGE